MDVDFRSVYSLLFQLWLDEVSIAEYRGRKLGRDVYARMYKRFVPQYSGCVVPLETFRILADDALIVLDVAAAIHCDDLGNYNKSDIKDKRNEFIVNAQTGKSFCDTFRDLTLVSPDIDLEFSLQIFCAFEELPTSLEFNDIPILDRCDTHTTIH